jgi:Tol biopolymer transport system component
LAVESLEDRRLLSIQAVSAVHPTLVGDAAGGVDEGGWTWTSDDGAWVAVTSDAPNLVSGQVDARRDKSNGNPSWNADVFLYNKQLGTRTLVSRQDETTATTANGMSVAMGISSNGQYVLFRSTATNLVPGQTDANAGFDIFLYDRVDSSIKLVSHSSGPGLTTAADGASTAAALSADGSFVAFASDGTNLVAGQTDGNIASDVFLWQRSNGAITLLSHTSASAVTTGSLGSQSPSISGDGHYVAFASDATDLVADVAEANSTSDVFLFDNSGGASTGTNTLVSHDALLPLTTAAGASGNPAISGNGQYVAYESLADNLVGGQSDGNAASDVFLFSRADGTSQLVSVEGGSGTTTGNRASTSPVINSDGRYVAFVSDALNLVAGQSDDNNGSDVFLFDRGATPSGPSSIRLVSHSSQSWTAAANGTSDSPSLSDDGRWIAYSSRGSNLVSGQAEGNDTEDVFLYDGSLQTNVLVSHESSTAVLTGDGASLFPVVSGGGTAVIYATDAANLVAGKRDDNPFSDIVLFENDATPENLLVTLRDPGLPPATGNGAPGQGQAVASANGRFVVFSSAATNLVADQVQAALMNVFLFDALTGQVQLVSHSFESATQTGDDYSDFPTISADGRYVAFVSGAGNLIQNQIDLNGEADVFLWDRLTDTTRLVSHVPGASTMTGGFPSDSPAISGDGRFVAFASKAEDLAAGVADGNFSADIFLYDLADESVRLISASSGSPSTTADAGSSAPAISADGNRVLFLSQATDLVNGQTAGSSGQDAFLFDRTGGVQMVSRVAGSAAAAGDGPVMQAALSSDGRYVAFESLASDLIAGVSDTNGTSDVFLYRVAGAVLQLISHDASSLLTAANGASTSPVLSADGGYLAFASDADNLIPSQNDANGAFDVFLYGQGGRLLHDCRRCGRTVPQYAGDQRRWPVRSLRQHGERSRHRNDRRQFSIARRFPLRSPGWGQSTRQPYGQFEPHHRRLVVILAEHLRRRAERGLQQRRLESPCRRLQSRGRRVPVPRRRPGQRGSLAQSGGQHVVRRNRRRRSGRGESRHVGGRPRSHAGPVCRRQRHSSGRHRRDRSGHRQRRLAIHNRRSELGAVRGGEQFFRDLACGRRRRTQPHPLQAQGKLQRLGFARLPRVGHERRPAQRLCRRERGFQRRTDGVQ